MFRSWRSTLGQPVDGASLAVVRFGLGICLASVLAEYVWPQAGGQTALRLLISGPQVDWLQPYPGFAWVRPLGEPLTTILVWLGVAACVSFSLGLFYRLAAGLQFVLFTWLWLLDQSIYGNHFYLGSVLALLFLFVPASRRWSLDRLIQTAGGARELPTTVPYAAVVLLRIQMWLIYFFAGASKIHPDWLAGEPIRTWFQSGVAVDRLAGVFGHAAVDWLQPLLNQEVSIYFLAYGGLIFDLVVGTLLCFRRTRWFAFAAACFFHFTNFLAIERVGVVAPVAWLGTTLFFSPDWPLALLRWLRQPRWRSPDGAWLFAGLLLFPFGLLLGWRARSACPASDESARPLPRAAFALAGTWFALQLFLSLRHFFVPGDAYWTEEGIRFSWALMTRNKTGQYTRLEVDDPKLFRQGASGWSLDASQWSTAAPPLVYEETEPNAIAWSRLPAVFLTYEPLLGERVFFRPTAQDASTAANQAELLRLWPELRSRPFRLEPAVSLERLLPLAAAEIAAQPKMAIDRVESLHAALDTAQRRASELHSSVDLAAQIRATRGLVNRLSQLAQLLPADSSFSSALRNLTPFALQGAATLPVPCWVIHVEAGLERSENLLQSWPRDLRRPGPEYVDLDRLESRFWEALPTIVVARNVDGSPRVCWNYWPTATARQREAIAIFPFVLHGYANHVASLWQARFDRRPAVRAVAYAELNNHPQALLVDPRVDLARAELHYVCPNAWILPRK